MNHRLTKLCKVLGVNQSTYYAWDKNGESKHSERRRKLGETIEKKFYEHKRIAGSAKIAEELHNEGKQVSCGLVAEIMWERGLKARRSKNTRLRQIPIIICR